MINPKFFTNEGEMKATRDGFGEGLVEAGSTNEKVVVLTADLKESTRAEEFSQKFPRRFVECGVAEQNMMSIAAGMAAAGKVPWVCSYAVFSPGRNWDQLRVAVCYSGLNVKIAGSHTGLMVGADGATHQALEDLAITRVLPNMTVVVPCDATEAKKATRAGTDKEGPFYLRYTKEKTPILTEEETNFEIGKAYTLWESEKDKQAAIVGCGPILAQCVNAAVQLDKAGIGVTVINNHTIKPVDKQAIVQAAEKCRAVVTVEDHQITGGMGSAVAEVLASNCPVPMEFVGIEDSFGESGQPQELLSKYGLTAEKIAEAVKKVVSRK